MIATDRQRSCKRAALCQREAFGRVLAQYSAAFPSKSENTVAILGFFITYRAFLSAARDLPALLVRLHVCY